MSRSLQNAPNYLIRINIFQQTAKVYGTTVARRSLNESLPQGCNSDLIELNLRTCLLCYTQTMQQNGLDENGFIIPEVSYENILPEYKGLIEASITALKSALPNLIHSIYAYGSVARGDAVREKSDMDLLVIFTRELTEAERSTLNKMLAGLSAKYVSLVREVGVADCTYNEMLDAKNKYGWGAYLKTLCVCVDGEDLTKRFGKFKLSSDIAIGFNGDIDTDLQSTLLKIKDAETDEEAGKIAATFARKLIRTCYSMVMTRAQVWTTKLGKQADVFIKYFPEKRAFVRTLQDWVVQPPHNRNDVVAVLESEGSWVVSKFEAQARSV
jgi:uncharacterized protein